MATQTAYTDCYSACRAGGGDPLSCIDNCKALFNGDTGAPVPGGGTCSGVWDCFWADLPGTTRDVTGGIYKNAVQPLLPALGGIAAIVVGLAVLAVVISVRR